MNELKLVGSEEAAAANGAPTDLSKLNPADALNRRDIELIKRSLASMHKDCAELRKTIVALHAQQSEVPSKRFFLTLAALAFVIVGGFAAARPDLAAMLRASPKVAGLTSTDLSR